MLAKTSPTAIFVAVCALIAAALPAIIILFGVPISDPDLETFARLHLHPAFDARVGLTFTYFLAIVALHWFICPEGRPARDWYLLGFCFFLLGNGVDAAYRSVQYLVVHGIWAPAVLAEGAQSAAAEKITWFNDVASGIGFSFALLFAAGRLLMGGALIAAGGRLAQLCGAAIILNGLWNLATVLSAWPPLSGLGAIGTYYVWPWLAAIVLAGALGWRKATAVP